MAVVRKAWKEAADEAVVTPSAADLVGSEYQLYEATGFKALPDTTVVLGFANDGGVPIVGIHAGCNAMWANFRLWGKRLHLVGELTRTLVGCMPERFRQDDALAAFLSSRPTIWAQGPRLTLRTAKVKLRFLDRQVADPDRSVVGTRWTISMVFHAMGGHGYDWKGKVPWFQLHSAGVFRLFSGCTQVEGEWRSVRDEYLFHITRDSRTEYPARYLEEPDRTIRSFFDGPPVIITTKHGGLTLERGESGLHAGESITHSHEK